MPSKRICVVGVGRWGRNHVRVLSELGCLGGVVEPDEETAASLRAQHPDLVCFRGLDEALAADFDGYIVATPAETHFAIGQQILKRGTPVLVEKPLALTAREAQDLAALAERRGVPLMVGHVLLFHPAIRKLQELIGAGKIGRLQYIYSHRLNLGTVRTEENILWSFAVHDCSVFQYLIGAFPEEIVSRGGAFLQPTIHDTTMTLLRYPDNVVSHIFVSWLHPFKEHRWVIIGSKGMLSFEDAAEVKEIFFYEKGIDWVRGEPVRRDGPTETIPYDHSMPLTNELEHFIENLDQPRFAIADGRTAVEVLEILERASQSLCSGREVVDETARPAAGYFVHPSAVIDDHVTIGAGTKIWHFTHVQSHATIGRHCTLGQNVNLGTSVTLGDNVKIQNNVSVYEGVELEDHVFCGPSMVFTNIRDPRCKYPQRGSSHYRRTRVRVGASLGANCTIVCGNTIGRHAMIGAGAVVTHDVPDFALMLGVPAVRRGWVCECGERLPGVEDRCACVRCGLAYRLEGERLAQDAR